jgi:5-methylcytosine-specific restriction endonuclease McrA
MPTSPSSLCRMCSSRAIEGRKYCSVHATTSDDVTTASRHWSEYRKDDPVRKLYKTTRWKNVRLLVLRRDPLCLLCGYHASTVGDHFPLSAHELVAMLGKDAFFDVSRIRGLCAPCHDGLAHPQY